MAENIFNFIKISILSIIFIFIKKDKNSFVFCSYKNMKYNFYSRVFFEYVLSIKKKNVYFVINDSKLRNKLNNEIGNFFIDSNKISGIITCLKSRTWITSSKPIYTNPISLIGHFNVNLWHGTPFKKIAIDDLYQPLLKKIIYKYYYSICYYDRFVSPSEEVGIIFQRSFNISKKKIIYSGSVVGEMLNKSIDIKSNTIFNDIFNKNKRKYNVLYAPTYRDGGKTEFFPFPDFDKKELEDYLESNDINIFIRPHHLDVDYKRHLKTKGIYYLGSDILPEINFYLSYFDYLITDYSSILFDYMLTDGSLILIPYDYDLYRTERGLNYTLEDINYGKIVNNFTEFKKSLTANYKKENTIEIKRRFHIINKNQCSTLLEYIEKNQ